MAIVVFSVLLLAGLILRLPWKLLLLLAVIPAVGIFVPRNVQKWIWGGLTLFIIGVYLWIFFLPEGENSSWRTYRFDSEADHVFSNTPQNAAVHYVEIINTHENEVFSYPYTALEDEESFLGPWSAEEFIELGQWMDQRKPALAALVQTAKMPWCEFEKPIDYRSYQHQQLRLKLMKAWASVLIRSAHRDLAAGRLAEALEKELTILGMARHLLEQGTLLDQAVGYTLAQAAGRVLHFFILEYGGQEAMLADIESAIGQVDSNWPQNWQLILEGEILLAKNTAGMFYQVNDKGQTRISRDLGQGLHEALGHPAYRFLRIKELSRILVLVIWLELPTSPEGVGVTIEKRFDRYSKMVEEGKDLEYVDTWPVWMRGLNYQSVIDWNAKQQVSYYYPLRRKAIRLEALRRVTRILIELKRYQLREGTWPRHLEDLLGGDLMAGQLFDPVSELPFVYERMAEGFRLYGIGENKKDEGGIHNIKEGQDDRLYWPQPGWEDLFKEDSEHGNKIMGPENR